jgi:hypothetical protein
MKKILWVLGGLFVVVLVALVSVPLFVNVDQYRPVITAEANKHLNGKLELGALKLSLWGAVKIHAESIRLSVNGFPTPMVDTKDFHLEIPFASLFTGKPRVIAVLDAPQISVVKNQLGKMNALELLNLPVQSGLQGAAVSPGVAPPASAPPPLLAAPKGEAPLPADPGVAVTSALPAGAPAPAAEPPKVPALLAGATLGLEVNQGNVHYLDQSTKSEYHVKGLELDAQNLGLGSTMTISLTAPVEGKKDTLTFSGPVRLNAELTPVLVGTKVKSARGFLDIDATKLAIEVPGKFKKSSEMPLLVKARIDGDEKETLLRQADVTFHDLRFHAKGRLTAEPLTAKIDMNADPLKLERLEEFAPMLKAYALKGIFTFNANLDFTPEQLKVNGDVKVAEGAFFVKDVFKESMRFTVQAGFSESALTLTRAALSGPETELQLLGSVKNFLAPQFSFALTGRSFNADKALVLPSAAPAAAPKGAWLQLIPEALAAGDPNSMNPMAVMAANPAVAKANGTFNAKVGKVSAYGSSFDQVEVKAQLRNMLLSLQNASLKTYGGTVKTSGEFDLRSPGLTFTSRGDVANISGKEAFSNYFPKYQNTLEGTVNADWNVSGALYPAATCLRSMKGSAKMVARDGVLKSVDVQETINSAMSKVPFLKDKKPLQIDDGFKTLTANLRFNNGVIQVEPIDMQPRNKGFIVKGKSTIQESLEQETFLDVFDPQGLLPRDIQQPGKAALMVRLYGPLNGPKTDYEYTVKRLATNAGTNAAKNVAGKALDKFLGGSKEGEAGDPLRDAAEKLKKKFKLF